MSNIVEDTYEWVDVKEFTREVTTNEDATTNKKYITGEGAFDIISRTLVLHLDTLFTNGTVRGEDYAKYYVAMLESAQRTALELILKKSIADKQEELIDAQIASEKAKAALYERQAKGFDDDAKQKILKILVDAWGMGFSVASDDPNLIVPESINKSVIDSLVAEILLKSNLGANTDGSVDLDSNPFEGKIVDE